MDGISFILETPYIVNFRKPYSTITLLSFPFPPYTTVRGLIANAMGMGDLSVNRDAYNEDLSDLQISLKPLKSSERFFDMVLMKKLKSNLKMGKKKPNENTVMTKLKKHGGDLSVLDNREMEIYKQLELPRPTSAPFVKEFITPIKCKIYLKAEKSLLEGIFNTLINPARPLYLGSSEDFVIISKCIQIKYEQAKSRFIDSIVKVNNEIYPVNRKLIVGRVPHKFIRYGTKKKRDYFREDWIIAAPNINERIELNKEMDCFKTNNEYIAF